MADARHCLAKTERIGRHCRLVIERLFADRVLDNLCAAQGVIRLSEKPGHARLEAAYERALSFDDACYRTIKTILARGLDERRKPAVATALQGDLYARGGHICRDVSDLIH